MSSSSPGHVLLKKKQKKRTKRSKDKMANQHSSLVQHLSPNKGLMPVKGKEPFHSPLFIDIYVKATKHPSKIVSSSPKKSRGQRRSIIKPTTPNEIVALIVRMQSVPTSQLFIWKIIEIIPDTFLIFDGLRALFTEHQELLNHINLTTNFCDQLYDHISQFADIVPVFTETKFIYFRLGLFELMANFLVLEWDLLSLNVQHSIFLWSKILKTARFSSPSIAAQSFRYAIALHKELLNKTPELENHTRILRMFEIIHPDSAIYHVALQLAKTTNPYGATDMLLCKYIYQAHFRDQNDVLEIEQLIMTPRPKKPLFMIQILFHELLIKKHLAKCITTSIARILYRFMRTNGLRKWVTSYIKVAFHFLWEADRQHRYIWRQNIILDLMLMLRRIGITWLSDLIATHAGTILKLKRCKKLFAGRFDVAKAKDEMIKDYNQYQPIFTSQLKNLFNRPELKISDFPDSTPYKRGRPLPPVNVSSFTKDYPMSVLVDFPYFPK